MKLFTEHNGNVIEVGDMNGISNDCDTLVFKLQSRIHPNDMKRLEEELNSKTNKICIVVDSSYEDVIGKHNGTRVR